MNVKERNDKKTDQAWNKLYSRLEQDGLLPDENIIAEPKKLVMMESIGLKWVAAIAILICISSILLFTLDINDDIRKDLLTLHNEKDAPTLVTTLEDGSVVYLSDYTSLYYPRHFEASKREVSLEGNAFFEISKNKQRPFFIDTEIAIIEVLGTSFDIRNSSNQSFSLSVKTGEVKVTLKKDKQSVHVKAGEKVLVESGQLKASGINDNNEFDTYHNNIHFKDERLADVVRIINMNAGSQQLTISPSLENRLLTMTISKESPDTIAELICIALNLQFTRQQNTIFISETQ